MNMLFADTLKKLRTEKGLSQRELAEQMYAANAAKGGANPGAGAAGRPAEKSLQKMREDVFL